MGLLHLRAIKRGINDTLCHTVGMHRLIWAFAGHTCLIEGFVVRWFLLKWSFWISVLIYVVRNTSICMYWITNEPVMLRTWCGSDCFNSWVHLFNSIRLFLSLRLLAWERRPKWGKYCCFFLCFCPETKMHKDSNRTFRFWFFSACPKDAYILIKDNSSVPIMPQTSKKLKTILLLIRASLRYAFLMQSATFEPCMLGFWNFIYGFPWQNSSWHIFLLGLCPFSELWLLQIIEWNLVSKISQKRLNLDI